MFICSVLSAIIDRYLYIIQYRYCNFNDPQSPRQVIIVKTLLLLISSYTHRFCVYLMYISSVLWTIIFVFVYLRLPRHCYTLQTPHASSLGDAEHNIILYDIITVHIWHICTLTLIIIIICAACIHASTHLWRTHTAKILSVVYAHSYYTYNIQYIHTFYFTVINRPR